MPDLPLLGVPAKERTNTADKLYGCARLIGASAAPPCLGAQ
jgi:hypothetical protein